MGVEIIRSLVTSTLFCVVFLNAESFQIMSYVPPGMTSQMDNGRIRLFPYETLVLNGNLLVKICRYIREFSIRGPK
jgi:hypothetical protein